MDIKNMSLDEKIGQMIVAGFPSGNYDDHLDELIRNKVGNVILFLRNISDKKSITELTNKIQRSMIGNIGVPGFIAIDQEGGMVTRIYEGATRLPGNMAFAAAGDYNAALKAGEISGEELRAMGININLAPVLDVNNNPDNPVIGVRSYGDNPRTVAEYGVNTIRGLQSRGVIATAKHFPGHGDTNADSHLSLPLVSHPMERLEKVELYPFTKAIENGVDAIMSAHILFPAIEGERLPATLSYKVLTGLLRRKMGFKGLIITDCMEMKAIADNYGTTKAAVMAVKAGADLICISHRLDMQIGSLNAIKKAVSIGDIAESRIDESVERILSMKEKYDLFGDTYGNFDTVDKIVGSKEHLDFAKAISKKSITVIKDDKGFLPVKASGIMAVSTEPAVLTGADESIRKKKSFAEAVKGKFGGEAYTIGLNPDEEEIGVLAEKAGQYNLVVIGSYNASLNKGQVRLVNELLKVNKNIIVVALRNPYDMNSFNQVPCYICAYEYTELSIESTVDVLAGEARAGGRPPVKL